MSKYYDIGGIAKSRSQLKRGKCWSVSCRREVLEQRCCLTSLGLTAEPILVGDVSYQTGDVAAVGDLDGDGDVDLVLANERAVGWLQNQGNGAFGAASTIVELSAGTDSEPWGLSVELGDIDSDGDLDVLVYGDGASWYANEDGLGGFGAGTLLRQPGVYDAALADLDGDGDLDLTTLIPMGRHEYGGLQWQENIQRLRPGTFGSTMLTGRSGPLEHGSSVQPADVNGDGRLDLVVNSIKWGDCVFLGWHENTGGFVTPLTEARPAYDASPEDSRCVDGEPVIVDLDGDGDLDIVGHTHNEIWWMSNLDGQGSFSSAQILPGTEVVDARGRPVPRQRVDRLVAADMDNDGWLDLVIERFRIDEDWQGGESELSWQRNVGGTPSFSSAEPIGDKLTLSLVEDVDSDGVLDILVHDGQQLTLLRSAAVRETPALHAADLDGDGLIGQLDRDILFGNFGRDDLKSPNQAHAAGDLNDDGRIDFADFLQFRHFWRQHHP